MVLNGNMGERKMEILREWVERRAWMDEYDWESYENGASSTGIEGVEKEEEVRENMENNSLSCGPIWMILESKEA